MFKSICCFSSLIVLSLNLIQSLCYVNYQMFHGFNDPADNNELKDVISKETETIATELEEPTTVTTHLPLHKKKTKHKSFNQLCPETEQPISIGSYEIPTQRDLLLFTKRMLIRTFNKYHEKALILLKDIKEATKASKDLEKKCLRNKESYTNCVKNVNKRYITITKDIVRSIEVKKGDVANLTEGQTCNMTSLKTNPLDLIKVLAMDEVVLDFALPGFLRLLGGCSAQCDKSLEIKRLPTRHMTDQDLVVQHFLTKKSYEQLIKNKL